MKKKILFTFMLCLCATYLMAQKESDIGRLTIQAYVPESENLPASAAKLLQSKLSQIITANGIADNEIGERFVLTAKVHVITKDIVAGPPQRFSEKLETILILGDIKEDKVYAQLSVSAVGIGLSEEKAMISAFKNINPQNKQITEFMENGKEKVIAYYQSNCPILIGNAKALADKQQYEEALWTLASVPDVCQECFDEANYLSADIYKRMINSDGERLLKEARAAWAQQPNKDGADIVMENISKINSDAKCMPQVNELIERVNKKLVADEKQEWAFKLEQYRNEQKREAEERAYAQQRYAELQQTNRVYIKACRDVAVSYYKNRPSTVNYYARIYNW